MKWLRESLFLHKALPKTSPASRQDRKRKGEQNIETPSNVTSPKIKKIKIIFRI
jgi:hypothetical protein